MNVEAIGDRSFSSDVKKCGKFNTSILLMGMHQQVWHLQVNIFPSLIVVMY